MILPFSRRLLLLAGFSLASAFARAAKTPDADEPVKLDKYTTTAVKAASLSLPLDANSFTGSRLGLANRDLPASVSIVTQELIQLRGARTAVEAIESAVGVTGGNSSGSIPNYATRGFAGNDVTILRDGIRQNTASQSSRPLDSFLFDRVEVLKGPASLLYGEGAIGGAVNYVSKLPERVFRGEVLVSAGSWENYRFGLGFGGPVTGTSLAYRVDATRQTGEGYVERSSSSLDGYAASARWEPNAKFALTFSGTFLKDDSESYYGTPVVYDAVIDQNGVQSVRVANSATDRLVNARIVPASRRTNYNNLDNFARGENSFWRLIADVKPSSSLTLRNEAYASTQLLHWRNTENYVWNPAKQLVDRSSFLLIYRDDLILGDRLDLSSDQEVAGHQNKFLVGSSIEHSDLIRNSGQSNYPSSATSVTLLNPDVGYGPVADFQETVNVLVDTLALYGEDAFSVTESLKLIGGLRWDGIDTERRSFIGAATFNKRYAPLTGRLGAIWTASPGLNLYVSYSTAAQPVNQLVSLNASQADFSLQKGRQFEAGAKATFWQKRADLTFAIFDIEKNDLLSSTLVDGVRVSQQIGAQISQGAELSLAVSPDRGWRIEGNLAWTWDAEFRDFYENLGSSVISRVGNTPPNVPQLVAGAFVVRAVGPWQFTAGVRHVGERPANNANLIFLSAYTTVDAAISYRWRAATFTLRGRNLTDADYEEWGASSGLLRRLADPRSAEISVRYAL